MFKKKRLSPKQVSTQATWVDDKNKDYDVIFFVHGIIGDQITTWGDFPDLLNTDPELPKLAIMQWGYKSGFIPANYHGVDIQSERLISSMRLLRTEEPIHVVAHSMGGLVTLNCIVQELMANRGQSHPINSLSLVTLIATPLKGSVLADLIDSIVEESRYKWLKLISRVLPKKQLDALTTFGFVDELTTNIENNIRAVGTEEETTAEKLTVQIVTGTNDLFVTRESAEGPFHGEPYTLSLAGGHSSIKLPEHHGDERYWALKINLVKKLGIRLNQLSLTWEDVTSTQSKLAACRIAEQYEELLDQCKQKCFGGRYLNSQEEDDVFTTFLSFANTGIYDPEEIVRMTVADFKIP